MNHTSVAQSAKTGALCISETLAIHAWCETHDLAAVRWLREKYSPAIAAFSADRLISRPVIEQAVAMTFERTLALLKNAAELPDLGSLLNGVAHQVCAQLQIESIALAA